MQAKKLIEVAMPIKEISAESVRDKSIRHGHISTLHLWWARRPLPVCRAVVFASLVPDPLDENCPKAFRDAVEKLLGKPNGGMDPYAPYEDIPYTSAIDKMEDNLRNRLMMFIGKFSPAYAKDAKLGKKTAAKEMLSDFSLIKWDNKNNEEILNIARKLIFVAFNAPKGADAQSLLAEFDSLYNALKEAETTLYAITDRHLNGPEAEKAQTELDAALEAFLDKMPRVFDPFAGGGAIPLEAARLGCRSYGNDINPVAHIIQKGSLEFPQKYGKLIRYSKTEFEQRYGSEALKTAAQNGQVFSDIVEIPNRLSFDVQYYAGLLLERTEAAIGHYYPADEKGKKPIAYYWARTATCSNPSCKAEVPLLKGFYLANTKSKKVWMKPIIEGTSIDFEIKKGDPNVEGWNTRGNLKCPCCGSITDVKQIKQQNIEGTIKERLIAVICNGDGGKEYRLPTPEEIEIVNQIPEVERPTEKMMRNSAGGDTHSWGVTEWGQMFSPRQLLALQALIAEMKVLQVDIMQVFGAEYAKAVVTYLAYIADKSADYNSAFCSWHPGREVIGHVFTKQAIPMIFDYPETYPMTTSSGGIPNMIEWIRRYIESESEYPFSVELKNASSGDKSQFDNKYLTAVITDPPYYDAMAYADLSDFFYVWLKRSLGDIYPLNFATPLTPKTEECTALKHHHENSKEKAKEHFENKLTEILKAIEHQTSDIVSIMFAHQSTEAWTTLCNSILGAGMNITGSWPVDTEMANRSIGLAGAALASSVTVSARPAQRLGYGDYKEVKKAIEATVLKEVELLYRLGFRGADLLTACFGQAVSEFGRYEVVEKSDGSIVDVAELLEMAREAAFNALLRGFVGDEFTKFYIAWLQLYGFMESDFDDAAKFSRVSTAINVQDLFQQHILHKSGNKQHLANLNERIEASKRLGERADAPLIDKVHKAMHLYRGTKRSDLLEYLAERASNTDDPFWRVLAALEELLPSGTDDHKHASGLLTNKDSLLSEAQSRPKDIQTNLFDN